MWAPHPKLGIALNRSLPPGLAWGNILRCAGDEVHPAFLGFGAVRWKSGGGKLRGFHELPRPTQMKPWLSIHTLQTLCMWTKLFWKNLPTEIYEPTSMSELLLHFALTNLHQLQTASYISPNRHVNQRRRWAAKTPKRVLSCSFGFWCILSWSPSPWQQGPALAMGEKR